MTAGLRLSPRFLGVILPFYQVSVIFLLQEWTDERLVWSEEQYNLGELVVEARKLWVPEFAIING